MITFILVLVCFCLIAILFINYIEEKEKTSNLNILINNLIIELNIEKMRLISLTAGVNINTNSVIREELNSELNSLYIKEDLLKRELQEINRRRSALGGSILSL